MTPRTAKTRFLGRLDAAGLSLAALPLVAGIEAMLAFYAEERADGCDLDDGDMLLFQWGANDWGGGPTFDVNITRQFMTADDEVRQLALTFRYDADASPIASGNRWCESPDGLDELRTFLAASAGLVAVWDRVPVRVELKFGRT